MHNENKEKQVVVISGGSGLIGTTLAKKLHESGHKVAVFYNKGSSNLLERSVGEGDNLLFLHCDITNAKAVEVAITKIHEMLGPITVCVHAAWSPITRKNISGATDEEFRAQFETGVFGGFYFLAACARHFIVEKRGLMIGITSDALSENPLSGNFGGYIAAKSALHGLLREFGSDLGKHSVRVYDVAPGFIPGGINRDLPPRLFELLEETSMHTKGKHLTSADDVADTIVALFEGDDNHDGEPLVPFERLGA